jgi:hypothetical protein
MKPIIDKVAGDPVKFALAGAIVVGVVYLIVRQSIKDTADVALSTALGVVSGNNVLTRGTPYEGAGVLGTLGAAANTASGGVLQSWGESLGGWFYDVTHRNYDPSTGLETAGKTLENGANETDRLWGPIGSVLLRAN